MKLATLSSSMRIMEIAQKAVMRCGLVMVNATLTVIWKNTAEMEETAAMKNAYRIGLEMESATMGVTLNSSIGTMEIVTFLMKNVQSSGSTTGFAMKSATKKNSNEMGKTVCTLNLSVRRNSSVTAIAIHNVTTLHTIEMEMTVQKKRMSNGLN